MSIRDNYSPRVRGCVGAWVLGGRFAPSYFPAKPRAERRGSANLRTAHSRTCAP